MQILRIVEIAAAVICAALCANVLRRSKHPFRTALINAAGGIAALGVVNLIAQYTDFSIAVNYGTSFAACVLGAPGVIALLILRLIIVL